MKKIENLEAKKSALVIKKSYLLRDLTYFNKVKFTSGVVVKIELKIKMVDMLPS